jgi:hypothetical protein
MLANLRALLGILVDIVLLRRGPDALPASPFLLGIVVAVNLVVSAFMTVVMPLAPESWALKLLLGTALTVLWYHVAFALVHKRERFAQTLIAIFGTSTLFIPVLYPLVTTLMPYMVKSDPVVPAPSALTILCALVALWLLIIQVRIVHAAFEWPYLAAILFIFAQNIASMFIFAILFGNPPPPV